MTGARGGAESVTELPLEEGLSMTTWVRVKDPDTGHESTVTAEQADAAGVRTLDKAATDPAGRPLPPKYHTTVDAAAASKKGA